MNVTVEELAPCKKLLRFQIDAPEVEQAFKDVLLYFSKRVNLPGFRAGKAPAHLIEKQFGKEIEEEVKRRLMNDTYKKSIKEKRLNVLGYPDVEEIQFGKGKDFQFAATVETSPDFQLPEYRGLPAKRASAKVTDEEIHQALEALRARKADFKIVDLPLQEGHIAVIDYKGTCDGQPLTDLAPAAQGITQKNGFWVEIAKDAFIPGFTDQLIGARAGESRTVQVDFPPDFVTPQLAGKHAVYETKVVEVRERVLPEIDDAFAQSFGAESLDFLRQGIRQDLQNELNTKQRRSIRSQIVKALSDKVSFELPESLVEQETRSVVYDIVHENQKRGVSKDVIDKNKDDIYMAAKQTASERTKVTFLIQRIAEAEGIRATQSDVNTRVVELAQNYKMTPKAFLQELEKRDGLAEIYQQLVHEKVVDFLQENAQIEVVDPPADTADAPATPPQDTPAQ